jgi:DNA polymerase kappa
MNVKQKEVIVSSSSQRISNAEKNTKDNAEKRTNDDANDGQTMSLVPYNARKGGMKTVNMKHVQETIERVSRGTAFWQNEQRRKKKVAVRVGELLQRRRQAATELETLPHMRQAAEKHVDALLGSLESRRSFGVWLFLDMDSFYASVEERDDSRLRDVPFAVGGMSMLSTANYVARSYGVRSAMPGFVAKALCPQLVIVPSNSSKYRAVSAIVERVLQQYGEPVFLGLDEAVLDLRPHLLAPSAEWSGDASEQRCADEALRVANAIREQVARDTGDCTCSIGLAPNRRLAKIASDWRKPNGVYSLLPANRQAIVEFCARLPVRKVAGIGPVCGAHLQGLGIDTCGQLLEQRLVLSKIFDERSFAFFMDAALGFASASQRIERGRRRKSISTERTFATLSSADALNAKLRHICERLAADIDRRSLRGKTVGLKVKLSSFENRSRSVSLPDAIGHGTEHLDRVLYAHASSLLAKEMPISVRLLGVRLANLVFDGSGESDSDSSDGDDDDDGIGEETATIDQLFEQQQRERQCPICNRHITISSNAELNDHIDECLSPSDASPVVASPAKKRCAENDGNDDDEKDNNSKRQRLSSLSSSSSSSSQLSLLSFF